jgi:hypothetical protein
MGISRLALIGIGSIDQLLQELVAAAKAPD